MVGLQVAYGTVSPRHTEALDEQLCREEESKSQWTAIFGTRNFKLTTKKEESGAIRGITDHCNIKYWLPAVCGFRRQSRKKEEKTRNDMRRKSLRSCHGQCSFFHLAWLHQWALGVGLPNPCKQPEPQIPNSHRFFPKGHIVVCRPWERSHHNHCRSLFIRREESDPLNWVGVCRHSGLHKGNKQNSFRWTEKHDGTRDT